MRYWFGEKIRTVRERRGLTLREVAERAGVSESMISQIERNRVSPAIDTLLALADALDLDLEYLFEDYRRDRSVRITRSYERDSFTKPGVVYERLARFEEPAPGREGIEVYRITLEPGTKTGNAAYGHPGWEVGLVEAGKAQLVLGNHTYELLPGDSASFQAGSPHGLFNVGPEHLRVFWIITPPKGEFESRDSRLLPGRLSRFGRKHPRNR